MLTLTLVVLLNAEPERFLGGAPPTPLAVPGPVDTEPTSQACSTVTLRRSSKCFFDGRPTVVETDAAKKQQAKDNVELARSVGKGLCNERQAPATTEPKEKARQLAACLEGTQRASVACSLEGSEVLLDGEGRFSNQARTCYDALATALQSAEVPIAPKEPDSKPARPRTPGPSQRPRP